MSSLNKQMRAVRKGQPLVPTPWESSHENPSKAWLESSMVPPTLLGIGDQRKCCPCYSFICVMVE